MPKLKDLRIGALAAESDEELFAYFVVTPDAETIVRERIGLVLGRKGSGKTALFRQGEELLQQFGLGHVSVIRLNMDDHAWGAFKDFKELGLSTEHAATVSWQLALLLQLAVALSGSQQHGWSAAARDDVKVLREFIRDNFGEIRPSLAKSSKMIGQISALKVGAFGTALEAQWRNENTARELVPGLVDTISQHLKGPLHESAWLFMLDQLDESWDGTADKKQLLVGLVKAVKRINDDFGWRGDPIQGARAVAFLRTDIYEALSFDDKDKLRDTVKEISWSFEELSKMLESRLRLPASSIFESKATTHKGRIAKGSLSHLVNRTFMRPRDLLQFFQAIRSDHPSEERITKRMVEKTEPRYSRDKVDDLRQEYRRGAPWIDAALDALKQGSNKFESRAAVEERLATRIDSDSLKEWRISVDDLIDWLTEISVLGAAPRQVRRQKIRFRCEGDNVSIEGDSTVWVHPALFLGLSLTEPRPRRG
ncbi:P-loop ATPase, Sll1717 family [Nonomuraea sp. CA-141351]|uniref:P-loop ATPase, Sll1717 family n=1 Tax=Nonomuraea sp. CA-141351 TaxID=3239996 RepID=UPI003D9459C2